MLLPTQSPINPPTTTPNPAPAAVPAIGIILPSAPITMPPNQAPAAEPIIFMAARSILSPISRFKPNPRIGPSNGILVRALVPANNEVFTNCLAVENPSLAASLVNILNAPFPNTFRITLLTE